LPDTLRRWVARKIRVIERELKAGSDLICHSYEVKAGSRRLMVRLNPHPDEGFLLLLEETRVAEYSVNALMRLGLTRREAEVLFWIGKDKTSLEVAELLSMSERTVKKHLEHIYRKFRVQTRLAAVMYALEKLGIMEL
jgi:DNA-binding CsgD family transcriptional regulator